MQVNFIFAYQSVAGASSAHLQEDTIVYI